MNKSGRRERERGKKDEKEVKEARAAGEVKACAFNFEGRVVAWSGYIFARGIATPPPAAIPF